MHDEAETPALSPSARTALLATTALAVVSDTVLVPFFPALFESLGDHDPTHVGSYLAATCLVVVVALPLWAALERFVPTLVLLVGAQACAGALALQCSSAGGIAQFWALSLAMVAFKASYLLVYPYIMRHEPKVGHARVIGLLTVIVHVGGVTGATVGGWMLEHYAPQSGYVVMATGDFVQMIVCGGLLAGSAMHRRRYTAAPEQPSHETPVQRRRRLLRLGTAMLLAYFATFAARPFFVEHWKDATGWDSELLSGLVFAIPAWMALVCLASDARRPAATPRPAVSLWACTAALALVAIPSPWTILAGLVLFGWHGFRAMVHLDVLIFERTPPESYARDFSRMHIPQQLGALVGFYAAGHAVALGGQPLPYLLAAAGFGATALAYAAWFNAPATP